MNDAEGQEREREALLEALQEMPSFLEDAFRALSAAAAAAPGPKGAFAPVEQCWHLADLEREGYGVRIARLRSETDPELPDFDGARVAQERRYRERSLAEGLQAFRAARAANLQALRALTGADWSRSGRQEGVGRVSLADVPVMMAEHDASHRAEIQDWKRSLALL